MQPHSTANRQAWLQRILPATPSVTKKTTPSQIIYAVKLHHKVPITYAAAKRAKKNLLGDDLENQAMQFRLLPAYVDAVCTTDLQAHVRLSVEDRERMRRFQGLFICPSISRGAFSHCRSFLAMDGSFIKEIFNLTILLAASIDVNNHSVLLAWAIVESENESSWRFFLSNLRAAIPEVDCPTTTIMSDRDKGLSYVQRTTRLPTLPMQSVWNIFPAMSKRTLESLRAQFSTYPSLCSYRDMSSGRSSVYSLPSCTLFASLLLRHNFRQALWN